MNSAALSRLTRRTALLALPLLAACGGGRYAQLLPEREHPRYAAEAAESAHAAALLPQRIATRGRDGREEPLTLSLQRPRVLSAPRLIVLLHGALSDHRTFRFLVPRLVERDLADVVTLDLPGCGGSDGWSARRGVSAGYTPTDAAVRVVECLEALEPELPDRARLLLVGHSYGGAVALRCALLAMRADAPRVLARLDGLALLSAYDSSSGYKVPELETIAALSAWEILLAQIGGWMSTAIAEAVWRGGATPGALPREEADRLMEILARGALRSASQWMLRRAAPWDESGALDRDRAKALESELRLLDLPCLLLWGAEDDTLPLALGEALRAKLPRAELQTLASCKHSPQVEQPAACARAIAEFALALPARPEPPCTSRSERANPPLAPAAVKHEAGAPSPRAGAPSPSAGAPSRRAEILVGSARAQ